MIGRGLFALGVVVALAGPVRSQTPEQLVDSATRLQGAGRWAESRELLGRRVAACGQSIEARPCRVTLGRALGYVYQHEGHLERAVAQYREVLAEAPADATSLSNLALALRSLGRGPELETLARGAISQDPDNAVFYWLMLGDEYEGRSAWAQAAHAYRNAIAAAPMDETPRSRLVDVYRQLPRDSVATLFSIVSRDSAWASRFPDAAASAYELVVDSLGRRNPSLSQRACLNWITVLADARVLTVARLEVVDQQWLGPQLDQLKRFIRDPAQLPPRQGLWGSSDGMESVGRAALSLGRQRLAAGDLSGADRYFRAGFQYGRDTAPVSLDLALEMAALFERDSTLDPRDSTFRVIEDRLLSEKATAYQRADLEAIQRFHTILGLIYVQRRVWGSTDVPWKNAVYQLDHALSTARRRDMAAGSYQPLPELREQLARAYEAIGRRDTARATYVAAAVAYLDMDQVGPAGEMISRGRNAGGGGADPRLAALDRIVQARSAVSAATGLRPSAEQCDAASRQATGLTDATRLEPAFIKRQGFKVWADCLLAGPADVRPEDAARVLTTAVRDSVPLVGVGDLLRIERSQKVINRTLRLPTDRRGTNLEQLKIRPTGPALQLQLPQQSRPTYLRVGTDALIGAAAVERLGGDTAVDMIRVNAGVVTVATTTTSANDRSRIQSKLQGVGTRAAQVQGADSARTPPPPPPPPAPPEYEASQRDAGELRQRAVNAGAAEPALAAGDSAGIDAAVAARQGNPAVAAAHWRRAVELYAQAARAAEATRDHRKTLEEDFRALRSAAIERRNRAVQAGLPRERLLAGDTTMREAERLMAQGDAAGALERAHAAGELWAGAASGGAREASATSALEQRIAEYARALESRRIEEVLKVVSGIDAQGLGAFLRRAEGLRALLQLTEVRPEGSTAATGVIVGTFRYREGGVPRERAVKQRAMFRREGGTWRLVSVQ